MVQRETMHIRVAKTMKNQLDRAAAANHRTLNGEVVYRLERSFAPAGEVSADILVELHQSMTELRREVRELTERQGRKPK